MANSHMPTFRTVRVPKAVQVAFTPTEETTRILENLEAMTTSPVLARMLRRAYAEVMLPIVRAAYLQGLPKAVDMQWVKMRADTVEGKLAGKSESGMRTRLTGLVQSTPRQQASSERYTLNAAYDRMRAALMRGDPEKYQQIREKLLEHQQAFREALQRTESGKPKASHTLSSGLFRSRALEVMNLFVDPSYIGAKASGDAVTVGMGPLQALEQIRTPSATEYVQHRGPTNSPYDVLWRHLEFGTGFYSKYDQATGVTLSNTRYTLPGGMWYYGRSKEDALTLYGSQGVHALYDQAGVPRGARQLVLVIAKYLSMMLSGKVALASVA